MNANEDVTELIKRIPEGYFAFSEDIESGVSQWNREAVEYFGFSDCSFGNTKEIIKSITHMDDWERLEQELAEVFSKEKEAFYLSIRMKNVKGNYVPCTCKGKIISGADGIDNIFTGTVMVHKIDEEYDAITDLLKVQSFLSQISLIKKSNKECLLMALKLKHFTNINALYGYDFGNKALYEIAKAIRNIIGTSGAVYRLESTSFGIVFNQSDLDGLKECYAKINNFLS